MEEIDHSWRMENSPPMTDGWKWNDSVTNSIARSEPEQLVNWHAPVYDGHQKDTSENSIENIVESIIVSDKETFRKTNQERKKSTGNLPRTVTAFQSVSYEPLNISSLDEAENKSFILSSANKLSLAKHKGKINLFTNRLRKIKPLDR